MKIHVVFGRDENINYYDSDEADIDLDEYVRGVCASEMGNSDVEALKAQAVAARTNAYICIKNGNSISDLSSRAQAFRASRLNDNYPNAKTAACLTSGLVLYYNGKLANPASFSSGNCGHTVSSKERWGSERAWLQSFPDPYDTATKKSHSVGMSQNGCKNMVKQGFTFMDVLKFYYPNTYLHNVNTGEDIHYENKGKEDDTMQDVKASELVKIYKQAADEHWPYVPGGSSYKSVDCSGLAVYAFKKLNGRIPYHGSNTMYRKDLDVKGKKGSIPIKPGYAVFVNKKDGNEPSQYSGDGIGNMSHIGYYVGDGKVVEAKGTISGTVYSNLTDAKWTHVGAFKGVVYDDEVPVQPFVPFTGVVTTKSGDLNFRGTPNGAKIGLIPRGTTLTILDQSGDWYKTTYLNKIGWVSAQYITKADNPLRTYTVTITGVKEDAVAPLKEYLTNSRLEFEIKEGAPA